MATRGESGWGNKPIIVLIGLIASCIAIFAFITGKESIPEIVGVSSTSVPTARNPLTPTPSSEAVETTDVIPTSTRRPTATPTSTKIPQPTFTPTPVSAWTSIGLKGEVISSLAFSSDGLLYVSTNENNHGVFKLADGEWIAVNNGLVDFNINYLAADASDPNILFAVSDKEIYKSSDAGRSWAIVYSVQEWYNYLDRIFLGEGSVYTHFYRSSDNGQSWQETAKLP